MEQLDHSLMRKRLIVQNARLDRQDHFISTICRSLGIEGETHTPQALAEALAALTRLQYAARKASIIKLSDHGSMKKGPKQ
jgi:hypothetical protein